MYFKDAHMNVNIKLLMNAVLVQVAFNATTPVHTFLHNSTQHFNYLNNKEMEEVLLYYIIKTFLKVNVVM